ncbi:MerR family transcriptional regulator [Amycolatopsis vancoresmycina]|uniref:MerR family transcriptional regulator n=1 Tax=Amycolatopsis vancoresmycina DSM 44592 TaxID=1292037 RepID=R1HGS9_9PSEU|nr:MerR family transcriptional regulator [Amycolatopsis vancoresmycina]EOD57614.1 MerR family transcriptional regulator [Amycolatopsis vancoresmycina DSM 44592]
MGTTATFTIGELARRTGLPVKTIRFYSDEGLLPPTDRTDAGYRLYDAAAMARLELVRTLRELGLGLADVSAALARSATVGELATRHVEALDEQIRRLRLRRAVLRAVAKRNSELEEVNLMNRLASMSDEERKRLVDEFWDEMVAGLDIDQDFYRRMRSGKPELPDDPSPEQLEAWIEFAELVQDPDFRALIRRMSETQAQQIRDGDFEQPAEAWRTHWNDWMARAQEAVDAGESPTSEQGQALAATIAAASARPDQDADSAEFRRELADRFAASGDDRAERYWQLLAIINDWPPVPTTRPAVGFMIAALRG